MLLGFRVLRLLPSSVFRRLMRFQAGRFTVGLVAVISWKGQFLFVEQRYRHGWSMPGGSINPGETPLEGVQREMSEEVGLSRPLTYRTHVVENSGRVHNVMFLYTADFADDEIPQIEPGIEIARTRWSSAAEMWPELHHEVKRVLTTLGLAPGQVAAG